MSWLLPLGLAAELLGLLLRHAPLQALAGALLVLFLARQVRSLLPYPRRIAGLTLLLLGLWALQGQADVAGVQRLLGSFAYYACFIGALGLAQALVRHSRALSEMHRPLLGVRPALRHLTYLLSAFAISALLSFGTLNLMGSTLARYLQQSDLPPLQRQYALHGALSAVLRGFALVPLVAPTSVTMAILSRELPQLAWSTLLPYGLGCALILLAIGWRGLRPGLMEIEPAAQAAPSHPDSRRWPLLLGLGVLLLAIAALAFGSHLSATQAAMLCVPLAVLLGLSVQHRRPRRVFEDVRDSLLGLRNEMCLFGASGVLGALVAQLLPVAELAPLFAASAHGPLLLGYLAALAMIALALLGIAPIVTLNLSTGALVALAAGGLSLLPAAVALLAGFSLAMLLSPYGPSALMLAGYAQVHPRTVAFGWNGRFALFAAAPLMLLAWLA